MKCPAIWNSLQSSDLFAFNIKYYHALGLSIWHRGIYTSYRYLVYLLLFLLQVASFWDLLNNLHPFDFHGFTENVGVNSIAIIGLIKYISLVSF